MTNNPALKDVPISLWRHPLIAQAYEVCQAIEVCGASQELTAAVTKASALLQSIANYVAEEDKWIREKAAEEDGDRFAKPRTQPKEEHVCKPSCHNPCLLD